MGAALPRGAVMPPRRSRQYLSCALLRPSHCTAVPCTHPPLKLFGSYIAKPYPLSLKLNHTPFLKTKSHLDLPQPPRAVHPSLSPCRAFSTLTLCSSPPPLRTPSPSSTRSPPRPVTRAGGERRSGRGSERGRGRGRGRGRWKLGCCHPRLIVRCSSHLQVNAALAVVQWGSESVAMLQGQC